MRPPGALPYWVFRGGLGSLWTATDTTRKPGPSNSQTAPTARQDEPNTLQAGSLKKTLLVGAQGAVVVMLGSCPLLGDLLRSIGGGSVAL